MLAFEGNPYDVCEDNITSSVVALEVKRSNGSEFPISGLENEIDIRMHHEELPFDTDQETFVLNNASSQFHSFNYSFNDVAVAIEFLSHNETAFKWRIMVAHTERPSVQNKLAFWSFNGKGRKLFLLESSLLKAGTYYIKVEAKPKVHVSSEETPSANVSYNLKTSLLKCFFWTEDLKRWSMDGCRVSLPNAFFLKMSPSQTYLLDCCSH